MSSRVGTFDLIEELGKGPHGVVQLAVDTVRDRMVAIKFMRSLDPIARSDRADEIAELIGSLSRIRSPFFGAVYTTSPKGEIPTWIAREYVNGVTLRALLAHCKRLTQPFATAILHGVAEGLAATHAADQVHGNVKLTNVLIQQAGGVKLVDPSIAGHLLAAAPGAANIGTGLFGAPAFVAPEQFTGGRPTAASDLYALGVLAYQLLLNELPFDEPDLARLRKRKLIGDYANPSTVAPNLPERLGELITRCLERRAEDRLSSAREAADLLRDMLVSQQTTPDDALAEGAEAVSYVFLLSRVDRPRARRSSPRVAAAPASLPPMLQPADPIGEAIALIEGAAPQPAAAPSSFEVAPTIGSSTPPQMPKGGRAAARPPSAVRRRQTGRKGPGPSVDGETKARADEPPSPAAPPPALIYGMEGELPRSPKRREAAERSGMTAGLFVLMLALIAAGAWGLWANQQRDKATAAPPGPFVPIESGAATDQNRGDALLEAARQARDGPVGKAVAAARAAVNWAGPQRAEAHRLLGEALLRAEEPDNAILSLSKAVELAPREAGSQRLLIHTLLAQGQTSKALERALAAIEMNGADGRLHALAGQAAAAAGRPVEAEKHLTHAVALAPEDAEAWGPLARLRLEAGRLPGAQAAYRTLVELQPRNARAYVGYGRAAIGQRARARAGAGGEAVKVLKQGVSMVPDEPELLLLLGAALAQAGRDHEAVEPLRAYLRRRPDHWRASVELGRVSYRIGETTEAVRLLSLAVAAKPRNAPLKHDLGLALTAAGEREKGHSAFESAFDLDPSQWQSKCEAARTLEVLGRGADAHGAWLETLALRPACAVAKGMIASRDEVTVRQMLLGVPCDGERDLDVP